MPALLRATGPALQGFGIESFLPDSNLTVYSNSLIIGFNDNWGTNAPQVTAADHAVYAFPLTDPTSLDAGLTASFGIGAYSLVVRGSNGGVGVSLAEMYDATPAANVSSSVPRLINVSAMTQAGIGASSLTAGFVILGNAKKAVLVRGIGPGLSQFGVTGVLPKLSLTVFDASGSPIGDIHSDELEVILGWHNNLLLVTRADELLAAVHAMVRVQRPVRLVPIMPTYGLQPPRANRSDANLQERTPPSGAALLTFAKER